MTVIPLDRCHLCNKHATTGVLCRRCLAYAADAVDQLDAAIARHPSTSAWAAPAPGAPRAFRPLASVLPSGAVQGAVERPAVSSGSRTVRVRASGSRPTAPTSSGDAA